MNNPRLSTKVFGLDFKNPVLTASGTFASGKEYSEYFDISRLGAVVTKGVSSVAWNGNDTPRIAETPSGMLNAIGLQNPGVNVFLEKDLRFLENIDTNVIVNVCGHSIKEYEEVVEKLSDTFVAAFEINISCPNVKEGGIAFGTDPAKVEEVTKAVKSKSKKPVIIKLSPNVTDIKETAKAAESGGADAISLINTLLGMKIDINKREFLLANKTGGLSGPAIHPVAVRMVYEASKSVKIPVIGMGGIQSAEDAIEMMLAGASLVMVGTANFYNPIVTLDIIDGIDNYIKNNKLSNIKEIVGVV